LDTLESRSEVPGEFWNVVLEKDGGDQLTDHVKNEEVLHNQGGEEYPTYNEKEG
jgi:hypothetical protein